MYDCVFSKAINDLGFSHPTPIQASTVPVALMGKDICACAATGTGWWTDGDMEGKLLASYWCEWILIGISYVEAVSHICVEFYSTSLACTIAQSALLQ